MTSEMENDTETATVEMRDTLNLTSIESLVANGIDMYLPPILFITGLVCNTVVILVMRAPYFAKVSTSLYMSFNALFDNVSILMVLPAHWLHVNFPYVIYRDSYSDFICKALNFLGWGTSDRKHTDVIDDDGTRNRYQISFAFCIVLHGEKAKYVIGCLIVLILFKDGIFLVSSAMVLLQKET